MSSIILSVLGGIGGLVVVILSIVAIRLTLKFDVNKWQERMDRKATLRLQNICPHFSVEYNNAANQFVFESFFVSPSLTTNWICSQCEMVIPSNLMIPKYPTSLKEIKKVVEAQKKFIKLAKKAGLL